MGSVRLSHGALGLLLSVLLFNSPRPALALESGDQVPQDIEGISLPNLHGRVTYVDFWTSWCPACRLSLLWLNELQEKFGTELQIVAVNLDRNSRDAIPILEELQPRFLSVLNPEGTIAQAFKLKAVPSAYLIDAQGRVVQVLSGFRDTDKASLEATINSLLSGAL